MINEIQNKYQHTELFKKIQNEKKIESENKQSNSVLIAEVIDSELEFSEKLYKCARLLSAISS